MDRCTEASTQTHGYQGAGTAEQKRRRRWCADVCMSVLVFTLACFYVFFVHVGVHVCNMCACSEVCVYLCLCSHVFMCVSMSLCVCSEVCVCLCLCICVFRDICLCGCMSHLCVCCVLCLCTFVCSPDVLSPPALMLS